MRRRGRGFTLIEVMISLGIFAVVSYLLMEMLARQSRAYTVIDNVAEAQQNVRAVANLLERELRLTGLLTPRGGAICGWDTAAGTNDTTPDVLYATDSEALKPPADITTLVPGARILNPAGYDGTGTNVLQLATLVLDGAPFYDLTGDGTGDSDFRGPSVVSPQRGGVIIFDRLNPSKGASCGQITALSLATSTITVDFTTSGAVANPPNGTPLAPGPYGELVAVPAHGFWIQAPPGAAPRLMRDDMVVAEDVEDLQFAAFFDAGDDGIVNALGAAAVPPWNDAAEYPGSSAPNSRYISGAYDNTLLREIRVAVVVRTRSQDPDALANPALANQLPQARENRVFAAPPPADGFRRRVIAMTVMPRNVALKDPNTNL